jgi:adenylate cyclase
MEVLRVVAGDPSFQVKLNNFGVEKMRIPAFGVISTDSLSRVWVDWSQHNQSISLSQLPNDFGGAIVIVGPTAAGISNPISTPKGPIFPNDIQAAMIGTMMNKVTINRPDYSDGAEIITLAVTGIILLVLARWVYIGLASIVVLITSAIIGSQYLYSEYLMLFDASALTVGLVLVALHAYGVKFVDEFLQKQKIKKQFGTYLSSALVEKLQKNPGLLQLGGDSRELSIMFSDVRGFTSISEHYGEDVQGLTKIMNRYMTAMTAEILTNDGTLDKYIGDAKMAFWNAPLDDPHHAKNAVKTALKMLVNLEKFNNEIEKEGVPAFGMGLGINTATVVVGNMGSDQRFDYTCLGDGVNLASRLEGQSKSYGVKIVLGPKTADYVKDEYLVLELDRLAVKGKTQGVTIFTVLGENNPKYTTHDIKMHNRMLELYRKQRWDEVIHACNPLKKAFSGEMKKYYIMMQERATEYNQTNKFIENWDGVYVATSK